MRVRDLAFACVLAPAGALATPLPILLDGFDVAVGPDSLTSETAGVLDANGQPGIQRPVAGAGIFGGERDAQFFVGFGDPGDIWEFGIDPARGLYWDSGPTIHVNMLLEWDGSGDGSTFGGLAGVPSEPFSLDLSGYRGVELRFESSSADLEADLSLGNRDEATSPCGEACGFASGFSLLPAVSVPGRGDDPFSVLLPFADLTAPAAPFIPGADLSIIDFVSVGIRSAPDVTANDLVLRSVSVMPVAEPATGWLTMAALAVLVGGRRCARMKSQGAQENQAITSSSDAADAARHLQAHLHPPGEHVLEQNCRRWHPGLRWARNRTMHPRLVDALHAHA